MKLLVTHIAEAVTSGEVLCVEVVARQVEVHRVNSPLPVMLILSDGLRRDLIDKLENTSLNDWLAALK